jgi:biopolymer transport protein ExbD
MKEKEVGKMVKVMVEVMPTDIQVDGKVVSLDEFTAKLKQIKQETGRECVAKLACHDEVNMARYYKVQQHLQQAGVDKVIYMGEKVKIPLALPGKDIQAKLAKVAAKDITKLQVKPGGVLLVDGKKIKGKKAYDVLAKLHEDNPHRVFSVKPAGEASYADFMKTMTLLKKCGADRIVVQDPEV